MLKQYVKLLLVVTISASLLIGMTDSTKAQNNSSLGITTLDEEFIQLQDDPNLVTWEMLGYGETNLVGPFDSAYFSLRLPADWKISDGAILNLSLGVSVSAGIQEDTGSSTSDQGQPSASRILGAGTLTVIVNNTTLIVMPLDQAGEVVKTIPIPIQALTSANNDGVVEVTVALNSGASCNSFEQMNVLIRTSSNLIIPHESIQPSTNLVNFPRPIIQNSFIPDSALLVIPDQPSTAELQAALIVASGLGNLSGDSLIFDMVTLSKLTPEQEVANDLIFIGKPASLPVLRQFQLPLPVDGDQFEVSGNDADDGFVEMVNSPWNNANVVLIVSGNTDQGTVKAAQAVSTGILQPNKSPNFSVVDEVQTKPVLLPQPTDQTLASLGYDGSLFESKGVDNDTFYFNIPPGWTVASDSDLELVFGHSALINYASSGIVVVLNGIPIGSVRMSDATASVSANKILIDIPTSAVVPGQNRLDVRVNLLPNDDCSAENMRGLWVNIWPETTLHLPLDLALIDPASSLSLSSYPAPFTYYPLLDNTAFVLLHDNLESWRAATKIASFLGATANGPVSALNVFYADNLPEAEKSKYNLLIIGQPSQMPIMTEINQKLPIPFLDGSDVLAEGNFQVTYRIPTDSPMGYMEILESPWNPDNVVLAVLGNTPQGLGWATTALIESDLRSNLAGNFAIINDKQIIATDTRFSPTINSEPTQVAEVVVVPPSVGTNNAVPANQNTTNWVFPVFVVSIILIILISAFVAIGSWSRHRTRGRVQRGEDPADHQGYFSSIKKWFVALLDKMKNRRKGS